MVREAVILIENMLEHFQILVEATGNVMGEVGRFHEVYLRSQKVHQHELKDTPATRVFIYI